MGASQDCLSGCRFPFWAIGALWVMILAPHAFGQAGSQAPRLEKGSNDARNEPGSSPSEGKASRLLPFFGAPKDDPRQKDSGPQSPGSELDGIPLKKPGPIALPKRPASPPVGAPQPNLKQAKLEIPQNRGDLQKAIELINSTYAPGTGTIAVEDEPTDLEKQMLAPFLPGISPGSAKKEQPNTESTPSQQGDHESGNSTGGKKRSPWWSIRSGGEAQPVPTTRQTGLSRPAKVPELTTEPTSRSSSTPSRKTHSYLPSLSQPDQVPSSSGRRTTTEKKSPPSTPGEKDQPPALAQPWNLFRPKEKAKSTPEESTGSSRGTFASQPVSKINQASAEREKGSGVVPIPTNPAGPSPGAYPSESGKNQPLQPTRADWDGPDLPPPQPSPFRQPLPNPSTPSPGPGNSSAYPSRSTSQVKPSLSGRGDILPFPNSGTGDAKVGGPSSSESYPSQGGIRVPVGGFAESEFAPQNEDEQIPAPRLAGSSEPKIRGLIQALGEERKRVSQTKWTDEKPKPEGLGDNEKLRWRIQATLDRILAEKQRASSQLGTNEGGNPLAMASAELWDRARSQYEKGDFVQAMETLRSFEKTETRQEWLLPSRFLMASCLAQSGRADEASRILREIAANGSDRTLAELAQWRLSQIRSRIQLERTLEEVRARSARLGELSH